jgi:DNA-directed RNA polymerase specialized sigma24 family protein
METNQDFQRLLARVAAGDRFAETDLNNLVMAGARRFADSRLTRSVRCWGDADDVANRSLFECIIKIRSGKTFKSLQHFRRYLFRIIKRRSCDIARMAHAELRDSRRNGGSAGLALVESNSTGVVDLVEHDEFFEQLAAQMVSQPSEDERLICLLRFLGAFSLSAIERLLAKLYAAKPSSTLPRRNGPPRRRTIQKTLAKCRTQLRQDVLD